MFSFRQILLPIDFLERRRGAARYAAPFLPSHFISEVTLLHGSKSTYFYLYIIPDIFSRYGLGWMVASRESATLGRKADPRNLPERLDISVRKPSACSRSGVQPPVARWKTGCRARRDTVWVPQSETMEDDKHMRLIVPGLEAEDLQITAMPDSIIVQVEALSKESSTAPNR